MHIHVHVHARNFELISIKTEFLKLLKNRAKDYNSTGTLAKFCQKLVKENSIFITFSDAYTCTYVV